MAAHLASSTTARRSTAFGLTLMLSAMVLLNYVDRGALGIAAPRLKDDLALDATAFGLAISAFSWIYAPAQFAVGWLTSRVCVYRLVAIGLAVWAAATTLTAFTTTLTMLVLLRLTLGIGEGVAFPAASAIIARHVPAPRRGFANSVVGSSLAFGPALGTLAGGLILASFGWRPIFLIFGLITFAWLLPWLILSKPHWRSPGPAIERASMAEVLRQPAAWLIGIGHFFNTYAFFFVLAWLPLYLVKSHGFSVIRMTEVMTGLYLINGVASLILGWWSDRLVAAGHDESLVRKGFIATGLLIVAVAIVGTGVSTSPGAITAWLLLAGLAFAPGGTQCYAIAQIYAGKRAAGPFVGVMNGLGNISGIVGPIVTGLLVDRAGYLPAFLLSAAMPALGAIWWLFVLPRVRPLIAD